MLGPRELDDVVKEFLVESQDNLDRVDSDLLALERGEASEALLASVFRGVHTIKGTCGFLGLARLETVAHRGENLLSRLRDGALVPTPAIVDALLETVDAIRAILDRLERTGDEGDEDYAPLLARLEALTQGETPPASQPEPIATPPPDLGFGAETPVAEPVISVERAGPPAEVPPALLPQSVAPEPRLAESDSANRPSVAESTIRVDVGLLDRVMNLVGELVLARNRILQFAPRIEDSAFAHASQQLNLLTTELQEGVMKTRMQPIGNVWNKFPRMVRDLCHSCGKQVELELDGTDTELDRTIIEAIKDPLTHAVRNALDHGVETPEERVAAGKSPDARLMLRAYHEGGQVNIEVADDGRGINLERVREHAVARGLLSAERALKLSDREAAHLIFNPGFSTAARVTNVSGRGVGMDVVKTNVEKIGGSVDVNTTAGSGTTVRIKIPLTLAIIPALIVGSHGERFAIPQVSLQELVRLDGDQVTSGVEDLYGTTLYRLRGELLPLVFLEEALGFPRRNIEDAPDVLNIVVVQAENRQFGLVVDSVSDTEEIVVKPLGKELKSLAAFAGATIMGDGRVALILDVVGIAQRASILSPTRSERNEQPPPADAPTENEFTEPLLLFTTAPETRMALSLSTVHRLEELDPKSIERSSGRMVVQYRGAILPLVDLTDSPRQRWEERAEPINVVVYGNRGHSVGLIVEEIIDTVDESLTVHPGMRRPGTLGAVVVQGRVTDLIDIESTRSARATRVPLGSSSMIAGRAMTRQVCTFLVRGMTFGVDVQNVHEVLRAQPMTTVPLAPPVVRGLINLRGRIVTAVDMRARLAFEPLGVDEEPMNVVVHCDDRALSLLVDEIGDVLDVDESLRAEPPSSLSPLVGGLVECVYTLEGTLLLVLAPESFPALVNVAAAS